MRKATLFFALEARTEARRKQLLVGKSFGLNVRLHSFLRKRTLGALEQSGLQVLDWSDELQHGDGFAERFCNAIEDAFFLGYDELIVVGSDLPLIDAKVVGMAASSLDEGLPALAGTDQGGAGIIAIRRKDYSRESWMQVRWQSEFVLEDLRELLSEVRLLDTLSELNEPGHFLQLIQRSASNHTLRILRELVNAVQTWSFIPTVRFQNEDAVLNTSRRGPPAALAFQK